MHLTWAVALTVYLQETRKKLTEEEAAHFLYVVYRRTIPLEFEDALAQVREIMKDPKAARSQTT